MIAAKMPATRPAWIAMIVAPERYPPICLRIRSPRSVTRTRRDAGTSRYAAALIFGKAGQASTGSGPARSAGPTKTVATVKLAVSMPLAAPLPTASARCWSSAWHPGSRTCWSRSRMVSLFCRSVISVGNRGHERPDLVDDRRDDRVDRRRRSPPAARGRRSATPAPRCMPALRHQADQRVEADGQQGGDGDQHQGVPDACPAPGS